jgi:homocysteine S-methyltransferase
MANPITPFLQRQGALILDGGLATELERRGCDLSDELWSARLLMDDPDLIRQVHLDYYWAGADCCTSASYQASIPGFMRRGLAAEQARELIRLSVQLVIEARDQFWSVPANRAGRLRPITAASAGPYGAYLADGSEYTGDYDLDEAGLAAFHRERWGLLAGSGADILACETIPSFAEARALAGLLDETPGVFAWFSFSCRDGLRISDGTPLAECAAYLAPRDGVTAIGINCTPPHFIPDLIRAVTAVTDKPVIVYPNSGETYDPIAKCWLGEADPSEFGTFSREWRKLGAALIGGCCRTTPQHIRQISDRFRKKRWRLSES